MKNVLLISDERQAPPPLAQAIAELGYVLQIEHDPRSLFQFPDIRRLDLVLITIASDDPTSWSILELLADSVAATHLPLVAVGHNLTVAERVRALESGIRDCLSDDLAAQEWVVRLRLLSGAKERFDNIIDQNVNNIMLARKWRQTADKMDEELRLARRLQMDFLPHRMPEVGRLRLAARLYPAGWVSGDFYDAFRLDERHVGFYIADAIGHGMPAALLTIFVKRSLQTKRINGRSYELIPPDEALALLNDDLQSAELQHSPFISMFYCVLDVESGKMEYARAGHPRPLILQAGQPVVELQGDGPLLGVVDEPRIERCSYLLEPGQRLLVYTDGVERCPVPATSAAIGCSSAASSSDYSSAASAAGCDTADSMQAFFALSAESLQQPLEQSIEQLMTEVLRPVPNQPINDDVTLLAAELI